MTSYSRSIVTIGLSLTVSEINGDVRRKPHKNRQFSHPRVFNAPETTKPILKLFGTSGSPII